MAATRALLKPARAGRDAGARAIEADPSMARSHGPTLRVMPENLALLLSGSSRPPILVTVTF